MTRNDRSRLLFAAAGAVLVLCMLPSGPLFEVTRVISTTAKADSPDPPQSDVLDESIESSDTTQAPVAGSELLQMIAQQIPPLDDPMQALRTAARAAAVSVWLEQDAVIASWPKYQDVKDDLRQDLAATLDLGRMDVNQLRQEASRLRTEFWAEEGPLSPQGYRKAYQARLLLEAAYSRNPLDLAVSDELAETIQTAEPIDRYNPDTKDWDANLDIIFDLQSLRTQSYAQTRAEADQGRPLIWDDFARVADFAALFSALDPQNAADAFQWALTQGRDRIPEGDAAYYNGVLEQIRGGGGLNFQIYGPRTGSYPHDHLYGRRLPAFRGPDPDGRGLTPSWKPPDSDGG